MPGLVKKRVGFRVAVSEMEDGGKGVGLQRMDSVSRVPYE